MFNKLSDDEENSLVTSMNGEGGNPVVFKRMSGQPPQAPLVSQISENCEMFGDDDLERLINKQNDAVH